METRLDVRPLAEEIARLIVAKAEDDRIKWLDQGRVRVLVGKVLPEGSAAKQTLAQRRKRFRAALRGLLDNAGWCESGVNVWTRG
jgi:hypothetical protein